MRLRPILLAGAAVIEDYADRMPFRFTGKLNKLVIELK